MLNTPLSRLHSIRPVSGSMLGVQKPRYSPHVRLRPGHPLSRGLVGCWLFNETGGNTLFDISGGLHHATLHNGPTWSARQTGSTLYCSGSSQYASAMWSKAFTGLSIVTSLNVPNLSSDKRALATQRGAETGNYSFILWMDAGGTGDGYALAINGASGQTIAGVNSANAIANQWQHVVGTWDGDNVKVYVDGVLGDSASGQSDIYTQTEVDFGYFEDASQYYTGYIEYVYIYDRALSAQEIQRLYHEPYAMIWEPSLHWLGVSGTQSSIDLFDGKLTVIDVYSQLLDGKIAVKTTSADLFDGKALVEDTVTSLLDGKIVVISSEIALVDGKLTIKDAGTDLADGKVVVSDTGATVADGKLTVKDVDLDMLDGKVVIIAPSTDLADGKLVIKTVSSNLLDGKVVVQTCDTDTDLLDGKIQIIAAAQDLLDGKLIVKTVAEGLLDGRVLVLLSSANLLDGKLQVYDASTSLLDGLLIVMTSGQDMFDGTLTVKDTDPGKLDGKLLIKSGSLDGFDGKFVIKDADIGFFDGRVEVLGLGSEAIYLDGKLLVKATGLDKFDGKLLVVLSEDMYFLVQLKTDNRQLFMNKDNRRVVIH